MRRSSWKKALAVIITLLVPITFALSYHSENIFAVTTESSQAAEDQTTEKQELTQAQINKLTAAFMDKITQDIDANYKVINYDTKEELLKSFDEVAARTVSKPMVDFYFTEKADGLYIVPTETPAWYNPDNSYKVKTESDKYVTITQSNADELHGNYTIEIKFLYDGGWKIAEVKYL
ncbi:hypothetical protein [Terribacillus sp. DMT04]|uniref:hypothetical protein n=1 Tax=Terribacillus sp. DMT04 TaxID=2850441 RepID=UPI001C2B9BAE|nr:hypothetical protein [Terribacillus sp. DMT04]QXE00759.1 hypothetical protein KS242_12145 [Terribacillus sp. DMT04]